MTSDVVGMDELMRKVERLSAVPDQVQGKALKAGAEPIVRAAKEKVNVRTGKLQNAIRSGRRKKIRDGSRIEIGTFKGEAPHAHLVEFGHGGPHPAPPHPFLRPGYEAGKQEAYQIMKEELASWVRGATSGK